MVNLTPHSIVNTLTEIGKKIDEVTAALPDLELAEVNARHEFKMAYARAFLSGGVDENGQKVTESVRRAHSELATSELAFAADVASVKLRHKRDELKALQARLEIGRSLSAVMRLEWGQGS